MNTCNSLPLRMARRSARRSTAQRGIVLVIALIVLVAMSLAGLLMLRSVGTGLGIAGNIAFKQNATSSGDRGIETARNWIMANPNLLAADLPAQGYFATWAPAFRAETYDWGVLKVSDSDTNNQAREITPLDGDMGNRVRVVVHRLCEIPGTATAAGQNCVIVPGDTERGSGGGGAGGPSIDATVRKPYYRITTRVDGPRQTVSYIQVILF